MARRDLMAALLGAVGAGTALSALSACDDDPAPHAPGEDLGHASNELNGNAIWCDTVVNLGSVGGTADQVVFVAGYNTVGDGGGGAFFFTSGTGTLDGGITVAGSGGFWTRIYSGAINVRWYNPSNIATAIQAAINAAHTAGGGAVYFPAGTFTITSTASLPIMLYSNVTLYGDGAASRIVGPTSPYNALFSAAASVNDVQIRNLRFDQGTAQQVGTSTNFYVVYLPAYTNVVVEDCFFDACFGTAAVRLDGSTSQNARVANCYFHSTPYGTAGYTNGGVYVDGTDQVITGNSFISPVVNVTTNAYALTAIESHTGPAAITGNLTDGFGYGVSVWASAGSSSPNDVVVAGNTIRNSNWGILLSANMATDTLHNVSIVGNTVSLAQSAATGFGASWSAGISMNQQTRGNFEGIEIADNLISFQPGESRAINGQADSYGIGCSPAGVVSNLTVANNVIKYAPVKGIDLCLLGHSVVGARITGNLIVDAGSNAGITVPSYRAAIFAVGTASLSVSLVDVLIDGNRIIDDGTTSLVGYSSVVINYASSGSTVTLTRNRISTRASSALVYDIASGNAAGASVVDGGSAFSGRPTEPQRWEMYFDTTAPTNGKPIWWNGSNWVDASGNVVNS
jgi:hypothetical protein